MSATLASMTGFARAEREADNLRLRVEVKSVNGRGLDLRLRLAPGLDAFDIPLRQLLSKNLSRGSVNLTVTLDRPGGTGAVRVDQQALQIVIAAIADLATRVEAEPPRLDGILALPGILQIDDGAGELDEDRLGALLLEAAAEAVDKLQKARREEGTAIAAILATQLDDLSALVERAETHPSR